MAKKFSYLKEKRRMLDSLGRTGGDCDDVSCCACPLGSKHNGTFQTEYPEEAEAIVRKWAEEHPIVTNADKLEEVIKEVFGIEDGTISYMFLEIATQCCPYNRRMCDIKADKKKYNCSGCEYEHFWTQEYKEPKKEEKEWCEAADLTVGERKMYKSNMNESQQNFHASDLSKWSNEIAKEIASAYDRTIEMALLKCGINYDYALEHMEEFVWEVDEGMPERKVMLWNGEHIFAVYNTSGFDDMCDCRYVVDIRVEFYKQ